MAITYEHGIIQKVNRAHCNIFPWFYEEPETHGESQSFKRFVLLQRIKEFGQGICIESTPTELTMYRYLVDRICSVGGEIFISSRYAFRQEQLGVSRINIWKSIDPTVRVIFLPGYLVSSIFRSGSEKWVVLLGGKGAFLVLITRCSNPN